MKDDEQRKRDRMANELLRHMCAVRDSLHQLQLCWGEDLQEASDIMHVPAVNKHYPFDHELDEMVLRVQEWAVALDDEVRQMQLADPKADGGE